MRWLRIDLRGQSEELEVGMETKKRWRKFLGDRISTARWWVGFSGWKRRDVVWFGWAADVSICQTQAECYKWTSFVLGTRWQWNNQVDPTKMQLDVRIWSSGINHETECPPKRWEHTVKAMRINKIAHEVEMGQLQSKNMKWKILEVNNS